MTGLSADVWGAIGTWALGVLALVIATMQLIAALFIPHIRAFRGTARDTRTPNRIVVRLENRGGAQSTVDRIDVCADPEHEINVGVTFPNWESRPPIPFVLPGRGSAVVVLDLTEPWQDSYRVVVTTTSRTVCVPIRQTDRVLPATSQLPPGSLAIVEPPAEAATSPASAAGSGSPGDGSPAR